MAIISEEEYASAVEASHEKGPGSFKGSARTPVEESFSLQLRRSSASWVWALGFRPGLGRVWDFLGP